MLTSTASSPNQCEQAYQRLCKLIPGGVNSGARAFVGLDRTPLIIDHAKGCYLSDLDGNNYLDYCCSWGALILGHAPPFINQAVAEQILKGSSYGITHLSEEKLAQKLIDKLPHVDKVRFFSSGTEATMTAIRVARGFTAKDKIIKFNGNYHGHADPFLVKAGSAVINLCSESCSQGVPQNTLKDTLSLPYNDIKSFQQLFEKHPELTSQIAAIILEPIAGNMGLVPASLDFLQALRSFCDRNQSLLIFDEVISGFRVGLGDSTLISSVQPDLSTYGKIIGGGYPVGALGGAKTLMNLLAPKGQVFQAGTLSGNPVAMTAGYHTLLALEKEGFYEEIFAKTQTLTRGLQAFINQHKLPVKINQLGAMFTLFWGSQNYQRVEDQQYLNPATFKRFFHYMLDHGIYVPPSQFEVCCVSAAHPMAQILYTQNTILAFMEKEYLQA